MRKEFDWNIGFSTEQINKWYDHAKPEEVENGVVWINEPFHGEDVYCYLLLGKDRDLLIDTGMGIKPIAPLLAELRNSSKELVTVNTHWHFDHIGGNREFEKVYVPDNNAEKAGIMAGWTLEMMNKYYFSKNFWHDQLPISFNLDNFSVPGYDKIESLPKTIDLGDRVIKVINTPGHTPGGVSFFDETYGLLFPGDTLYEGPLYAFEEESNPEVYLNSLKEIIKLPIKVIHPGHNHSDTKNFPDLIQETIKLFERAIRKEKWDADGEFPNTVEYHHPKVQNGRRLKVVVKTP